MNDLIDLIVIEKVVEIPVGINKNPYLIETMKGEKYRFISAPPYIKGKLQEFLDCNNYKLCFVIRDTEEDKLIKERFCDLVKPYVVDNREIINKTEQLILDVALYIPPQKEGRELVKERR
jgi:hypothetical protein